MGLHFLGRRLLNTLVALWGLGSLVFLLGRHDPAGGPEQQLLSDGTESGIGTESRDPAAMAAARQAVRHRLGLDQPLFYLSQQAPAAANGARWRWNGTANQYHHWLARLLRGELGHSLRTGQPVAGQLGAALCCTLPLTGTALALALGAALWLGQGLAGPRRWWQGPVRALLLALQSAPLFVLALGLLLLLANPQALNWFPGYGLADEELAGWNRLGELARHLALPVVSLVLAALPDLALQLEAALRHELGTDYAAAARAKGLGEAQLIRHHALPNALLPTLTQVTGLVPALLAGALVVEVVYALPGMGRLLAAAAALRDYPVVLGGVLLTGAARLGALLLADVLYHRADPRIRWTR